MPTFCTLQNHSNGEGMEDNSFLHRKQNLVIDPCFLAKKAKNSHCNLVKNSAVDSVTGINRNAFPEKWKVKNDQEWK